ncbi:50S ribosomal protein L29 [Patescibacteria group bacterium]|nr:50S ribosomal protein L29 [Patescibacteria group bacterium]
MVMKTKEFKDLKNKEIKDLNKMFVEKRNILRKTMLEIKTGSEKNIKKGAILRNEIAKILTLIKEKEIINKIKKEEGKKQK